MSITRDEYLEIWGDIRLLELNNDRLDSQIEFLSPFRKELVSRIRNDNQYRLDKIKKRIAIEISEMN